MEQNTGLGAAKGPQQGRGTRTISQGAKGPNPENPSQGTQTPRYPAVVARHNSKHGASPTRESRNPRKQSRTKWTTADTGSRYPNYSSNPDPVRTGRRAHGQVAKTQQLGTEASRKQSSQRTGRNPKGTPATAEEPQKPRTKQMGVLQGQLRTTSKKREQGSPSSPISPIQVPKQPRRQGTKQMGTPQGKPRATNYNREPSGPNVSAGRDNDYHSEGAIRPSGRTTRKRIDKPGRNANRFRRPKFRIGNLSKRRMARVH